MKIEAEDVSAKAEWFSNVVNESRIVCPRAVSGTLVFDLEYFAWAESRAIEVATVTPLKAPELLTAFNRAWAECHKHVALLQYEITQAEAEVNRVKAEVLLDRVPAILKEKGLSNPRSPAGSEDMRQAILDSDQDYVDAQRRRDQLKCVKELFVGKLKNFEMCFSSVKKILDHGGAYSYLENKLLSGDTGTSEPGTVLSGFGIPKL